MHGSAHRYPRPAGRGKSTLARAIGARLDIAVVHLDALFWNPGWVQTEPAVFRARVAATAAHDAWVMDGNYTGTLDLRLARASAVIWLDLPRLVYFHARCGSASGCTAAAATTPRPAARNASTRRS